MLAAGAEDLIQPDLAPSAQDDRALDHVLELAHVARPFVGAEGRHLMLEQLRLRRADLLGHERDEVRRERDDVLLAGTQRRDPDREHAEAIVEILAEPPLAHVGGEVAVGRRDDAHVDGARRVVADAFVLPLLEYAEQLGLEVEREVADLVEEDRALLGEPEASGAIAHRPGERAADVAEELALEHLARDGAAVDLDERAPRAPAPFVDLPREELLPGPRLAQDQHRRVGRGDELDLGEDVPQRLALPDDATEGERDLDLLTQVGVLVLQLQVAALALGQLRLDAPCVDDQARQAEPEDDVVQRGAEHHRLERGGKVGARRAGEHGALTRGEREDRDAERGVVDRAHDLCRRRGADERRQHLAELAHAPARELLSSPAHPGSLDRVPAARIRCGRTPVERSAAERMSSRLWTTCGGSRPTQATAARSALRGRDARLNIGTIHRPADSFTSPPFRVMFARNAPSCKKSLSEIERWTVPRPYVDGWGSTGARWRYRDCGAPPVPGSP